MSYLITTGALTDVHSEPLNPLGSTRTDENGNIDIYLKGVASCEQGSVVTFDENHQTALAVANAVGRVAVAHAAVVADTYGWFRIYGKVRAKVLSGFADNGKVYLTATAGSVDDAVVAGDLVVGAIGRSAIADGQATLELNFPFATDALG